MPNKSSIALLAEIQESIGSCLNYAEHINNCMDDDTWPNNHCDLKSYWDSMLKCLKRRKRRLRNFKDDIHR